MPPSNTHPGIFRPPRQDTDSGSVQRLYETGTPEGLSEQPELPPALGYTTSGRSLLPMSMVVETPTNPGTESSTQEYLPQNKKPIWNVKSSFCQKNSLDIKLYETSVRELTGLDPDLKPFFDTAWKDQYARSWLPTETGCPDSALSYSSSLLKRQEESSWFSVRVRQSKELTSSVLSPNWERTSSQSFTFSPAATTEGENTSLNPNQERPLKRIKKSQKMQEKGVVLRCRKIRILPNGEQKDILKRCFGIHRHIYNECVKADKGGHINGSGTGECYRWRTALTTKEHYYNQGKAWKDDCPNHTKQQAVEEYFKNKKTASKLVAEGKIRKFDIGYKSRFKSRQETIPFDRFKITKVDPSKSGSRSLVSTVYKRKSMDFRIMGKTPKVFSDRNDSGFTRTEMKITKTQTGKYYAIVSFEVAQSQRFPEIHGDMISFDPGSKTFQTYHSPDGTWGEIGTFEKQEELLLRADRLKSRLDRDGPRRGSRWRRHLKRRVLKLFEKVRNRTADLHNKICSWVVNTYRLILVPEFKTKEMVSSSRLYSKTCRKMMTWSHYRFRSRLMWMAQKFTDVKVRLCNEAYTTRQCGSCGVVNRSMTLSDRIFNCSSCGLSSSRDGHAARNIGLRSMKYLIAC